MASLKDFYLKLIRQVSKFFNILNEIAFILYLKFFFILFFIFILIILIVMFFKNFLVFLNPPKKFYSNRTFDIFIDLNVKK